ncbi:MAG: hypothetical protein J6M62_02440 [Selenomonadaceae bacterium]|nr:hypothetical protein [Selenomonadaceae bacterium]MBP3723784.1 hypothetical protein [Selenomonadaceae bacterium]
MEENQTKILPPKEFRYTFREHWEIIWSNFDFTRDFLIPIVASIITSVIITLLVA